MKINRFRVVPHQLKRRSLWQTASYSADAVLALFVSIGTDDGVVGVGASSVMPRENATFEPGIEALRAVAERQLIGGDPLEYEALLDRFESAVPDFVRHQVAVELALFDLVGKIRREPVASLLGGARRDEIPVLKMLGMGTTEFMATRARELAARGYRHLKVKLGAGEARDLEWFGAVRAAVGPDVGLTCDFNGAYDAPTAIRIIDKLTQAGLAMVEQPVPAPDIAGMAAVNRAVEPVVLADQSVDAAEDVEKIAANHAARAVSIKLLKLGGIRKSLAVVKACEAAGLACHVGGTGTTRLVEAAQAHFISATPAVLVPSEIAEFEELDGDLVSGFEVEGGALRVPAGPGLGVAIDL